MRTYKGSLGKGSQGFSWPSLLQLPKYLEYAAAHLLEPRGLAAPGPLALESPTTTKHSPN